VVPSPSKLWNSGSDSAKEQARKQKRKTQFISNVLVIDDPANPENNGKVFLYKYGKKIFEKINDKMFPSFQGDKRVNVFDFWEGANFKLRIREVDKFPNYDKSEFADPAPLFDGDDKRLELVWNKQYPLKPLIAPDQFKSYDALKARMNKVLGSTPGPVRYNGNDDVAAKAGDAGADVNEDVPWDTTEEEKIPVSAKTPAAPSTAPVDEDDELDFFRKLRDKK
jgi:gp32-like DNA binding protein